MSRRARIEMRRTGRTESYILNRYHLSCDDHNLFLMCWREAADTGQPFAHFTAHSVERDTYSLISQLPADGEDDREDT